MSPTTPVATETRTSIALAAAARTQWLSVVSHTDPRYGGLSSAVPRTGAAVTATGRCEVSLAAFCAPDERFVPQSYELDRISFWPVSRRPWFVDGRLRSRFRETVSRFDGVHIHGLWEASTAAAARSARSVRKPYIVSAHGMLEPWALQNKRWKKELYARLVERDLVAGAACLHALTRAEAQQYRAFGARGPIAIVPNAVQVPDRLSPCEFLDRFPGLEGRRLVLFLGRLHPKKGLDLLSGAWAEIAPRFPEAHLVLAGPDAEGTQARFEAAMTGQGIADRVTFTGMLQERMKWSAMAAAEAFVLPSFSEGLSMGVLEALGAGLPAILTDTCNMPEAAEAGAALQIRPDRAELTAALEHLLRQSPEKNQAMGARGRYLVTSRYNPRQVAEEMADIYDFALSGIPTTNVERLFA